MDKLRIAFESARQVWPPLGDLIEMLADKDVVFVGSGGGVAVAQFASDLHITSTGKLASASTPLILAGAPPSNGAVVVLSARVAHPDVGLALRSALQSGNNPVALITFRPIHKLPAWIRDKPIHVISLPAPPTYEGFLATSSVLGFCAHLAGAYSGSLWDLPDYLPQLDQGSSTLLQERCLVLFGPRHSCVGTDLETRLSELGVCAVQATDYRNFSHGRHYGLFRNIDKTTVVSIQDPSYADLAGSYLDLLPPEATIVHLNSELSWPGSVLDLLVASIKTSAQSARSHGINPEKPGVPKFGRRLYRNSAARKFAVFAEDPIERKLRELPGLRSASLRELYRAALDDWLSNIGKERFTAALFDYDGTVCSTADRYSLPENRIQAQVLKVLASNVTVAFASGRGGSLHKDLRTWIPKELWPQVRLALYTGSMTLSLDDELPSRMLMDSTLEEMFSRLNSIFGSLLKLDLRPSQLMISILPNTGLTVSSAALWAEEIAHQSPRLPIKVIRSAHSVDVVPELSSKATLLDTPSVLGSGPALVFGDQGQSGGNDFEMLAASRWTLSVDRCSADPTRCWNLSSPGKAGPTALFQYLKRFRLRDGDFSFTWRSD